MDCRKWTILDIDKAQNEEILPNHLFYSQLFADDGSDWFPDRSRL